MPLWQAPAVAGPLVVALPLTSYDYVWLMLLLPLVLARERRIVGFVGYCVITQLFGIFQPDLQVRHVYHSLFCLVLMVAFMYDLANEWARERSSPPQAARAP